MVFPWFFGLATIGTNGFSTVANHWSNNGMVTIHRYGLGGNQFGNSFIMISPPSLVANKKQGKLPKVLWPKWPRPTQANCLISQCCTHFLTSLLQINIFNPKKCNPQFYSMWIHCSRRQTTYLNEIVSHGECWVINSLVYVFRPKKIQGQ